MTRTISVEEEIARPVVEVWNGLTDGKQLRLLKAMIEGG